MAKARARWRQRWSSSRARRIGAKATAHGLAAPATPKATAARPPRPRAAAARAATVAARAMPSSRWVVRTATSPQTRTRRTPPTVVEIQVARGSADGQRRPTSRVSATAHQTPTAERVAMAASAPAMARGTAARMLSGPNWNSGCPAYRWSAWGPGSWPMRRCAAWSNQCQAVACRKGIWTTSTVAAVSTKAPADNRSRRLRKMVGVGSVVCGQDALPMLNLC